MKADEVEPSRAQRRGRFSEWASQTQKTEAPATKFVGFSSPLELLVSKHLWLQVVEEVSTGSEVEMPALETSERRCPHQAYKSKSESGHVLTHSSFMLAKGLGTALRSWQPRLKRSPPRPCRSVGKQTDSANC